MSKKILFAFLFALAANSAFSQATNQSNFISKPLPQGPITTVSNMFLKCRITNKGDNPCNVVFNVAEATIKTTPFSWADCGAILRFKNDLTAPANPSNLIDVYAGSGVSGSGAYEFNTDGLTIKYDKDYDFFWTLDIAGVSKTFSVIGRSEDMTELYTLATSLNFRAIPVTALNNYSILYGYDTITTPQSVMRVKEFIPIPELSFASSISIDETPALFLNIPIQLSASVSPYDATAGVAWKVVKGDSYATIDGAGIVTLLKDTIIDIEAYAVQMKGSTPVKASAQLNVKTSISNTFNNTAGIKFISTISSDGKFLIQKPENLVQKVNYKVYSIFGQELKSGLLEGSMFDIGASVPGLYLVHFQNSILKQTSKLIVK